MVEYNQGEKIVYNEGNVVVGVTLSISQSVNPLVVSQSVSEQSLI